MNTVNTIDRTNCNARYHGDIGAYKNGCRCVDTQTRRYRYFKRRRLGHPEQRRIPTLGLARRIQALNALGHSSVTISQHAGIHDGMIRHIGTGTRRYATPRTAHAIHTAYQALKHTPGTCTQVRNHATRMGWHPPAYWDTWGTIDDPEPIPTQVVDDYAIHLVTTGAAPIDTLHPHEQLQAFQQLRHQGLTDGQIRYRLNLSPTTTRRLAHQLDQPVTDAA